MMIDQKKLKPCPFCGRKPMLVYDRNAYKVFCQNGFCLAAYGWSVEKEDVIKGWNKRALKAAPAVPVEWLREKMNIADDAGDLDSADLISWLIQTWQKEQEER